ncbi:uncharacterized protein FYW47_009228 [Aplochiton taeniatus]
MPYHDEEYPGQSLWQSVTLFCCKGMIEGIMVVLFFWLLVQVLFTKHLEVHLQILLLVGLVAFCLCLVLGCILCWRMSRTCPLADKEPLTSAPAPTDLATLPESPPLSSATAAARQEYEELEGDILDYPSTFSSPTRSDQNFASLSFASRAGAELKEHPKSPVYKPIPPCRTSFRSLTRLGLLSKTRRMLDRRCTVTGDSISDSERVHLTRACSSSVPEEPIPLSVLGSGSSSGSRTSPPGLHFTTAFSPEQGTLTVALLSLTGASHRLQEVSVLGSLAPLYPSPLQASTSCSLSPEPSNLLLVLRVRSVEELQRCVLRLAVYTQNPPSQKGMPMGDLEVQCGEMDWKSNQPILFTKELSPNSWKLEKGQESWRGRGPCPPPQVLGQLFILLQYQTLVHRIKAMVLRADNLASVNQTIQSPDYRVVINLRHEGTVVSTRETKGSTNTLWKTSVLFDLPPGDVTQLPLMLEFIILQNQVHSKGAVLGRVFIGPDAPEAGQAHWEDMCSQVEVERARWHTLNPEPL